jgi:hypothetical protein
LRIQQALQLRLWQGQAQRRRSPKRVGDVLRSRIFNAAQQSFKHLLHNAPRHSLPQRCSCPDCIGQFLVKGAAAAAS